jgi:hypothetical protein
VAYGLDKPLFGLKISWGTGTLNPPLNAETVARQTRAGIDLIKVNSKVDSSNKIKLLLVNIRFNFKPI